MFCLQDMTLKDASEICELPYMTFREIKIKLLGVRWDFYDLRCGRLPKSKWWDLKKIRENLINDDHFRKFRDILIRAAEHGDRCRKLFMPKKVQSNKNKKVLKINLKQVEIHQNPENNARVWTLFTSLNANPTPVQSNHQISQAVSQPQSTIEEVQCVSADVSTQITSATLYAELKSNELSYKTARARDINRPNILMQTHANSHKIMIPKEVQLRPWMLLAHIMFGNAPKFQPARSIFLPGYWESTLTPLWIYSDHIDWFHTRHNLIEYGMDSVLVLSTSDALPAIEPIDDWSWLLTMGLART